MSLQSLRSCCGLFQKQEDMPSSDDLRGVAGCRTRMPTRQCVEPYFWNFVMNGFLRLPYGDRVRALAYADDGLLVIEANSRPELERLTGEALEKASEWGATVKVKFSPEKTSLLYLKECPSPRHPPRVFLDGVRVRMTRVQQYLGVWIGEGFTFGEHIARITTSALQAMHSVRAVAAANWGFSPKALRALYRGLYKSIVTYAAPVWYDYVTRFPQHGIRRRKLLSAQRRRLLTINRCYRTVSTDSLPVVAGV